MKKQLSILTAFFAMSLFILSSCSSKDDPTPAPKTKTQLVTQSSWKATSATVSGTAYPLPACVTDNIYVFTTAGTGTINESTVVCAGAAAGTTPFTWSFQAGETSIQLSAPLISGGLNSITIISLTETELVVSFPYSPGPGVTVTIVVTFQH